MFPSCLFVFPLRLQTLNYLCSLILEKKTKKNLEEKEENIMATVEIGNEELVPRIEKAIVNLKELREGREGAEEKVRLTNKIEGMELILHEQGERFQNMKTAKDVVTLAAMIAVGAEENHAQAVNLVQGYLMEYATD